MEKLRILRLGPSRIHEEIKKGSSFKYSAAQAIGGRSTSPKGGCAKELPLVEKRKIVSEGKPCRKPGDEMQFKVINVPDPPSGKQPDSGVFASMESGKAVTMNIENEERISAHKSNASNDTSTSTWSNVHLLNNTGTS